MVSWIIHTSSPASSNVNVRVARIYHVRAMDSSAINRACRRPRPLSPSMRGVNVDIDLACRVPRSGDRRVVDASAAEHPAVARGHGLPRRQMISRLKYNTIRKLRLNAAERQYDVYGCRPPLYISSYVKTFCLSRPPPSTMALPVSSSGLTSSFMRWSVGNIFI